MFATWPMVFGALVAGLIAGFLIPEVKQKPAGSTVVAAKTGEAAKAAEPKRALPTPKTDSTSAPAPATNNASAAALQKSAENAENDDCERQTWPYLTPNCLDRSAQAATPDIIVQTKAAEPKPVNDSERKPEPAQAPAATASTAPKTTPKTDTEASIKSAATAAAPDETRPADRQQPAQAAAPEKQAAPAPEKSARRPAARARAEVIDEPVRPRAERYRGERRYAGGQIEDDDDRPVYIRRGGRLYLAPEYHHQLRMQDRYWRDW